MPGRALIVLALARVRHCAAQVENLERAVLDQSLRFGPILKEAMVALESKLTSLRPSAEALTEVGPVRAQLLWRELEPRLQALEDGLADLGRLLESIAGRYSGKSADLETAYDEFARLEQWFLMRLRHLAGEAVSEGYYRCCACGAYNQPGSGDVLGPCRRCGDNCHHHVSSL